MGGDQPRCVRTSARVAPVGHGRHVCRQATPRPRLVLLGGWVWGEHGERSDVIADLQELDEIKGLVDRGQQLGVLTFAQVAGAGSWSSIWTSFLERAAIELVEEVDPALAAVAELERGPEKRGRRKPKTALDLSRT